MTMRMATSRALWRQLFVRTFMQLQRQYPGLASAGLAHLARDAADAALDEMELVKPDWPAPTPRRSVDDE